MYVLTIREGLHTRHIGPYDSPARAAAELDALLGAGGERAHWQIHLLEAPLAGRRLSAAGQDEQPRGERGSCAAATVAA